MCGISNPFGVQPAPFTCVMRFPLVDGVRIRLCCTDGWDQEQPRASAPVLNVLVGTFVKYSCHASFVRQFLHLHCSLGLYWDQLGQQAVLAFDWLNGLRATCMCLVSFVEATEQRAHLSLTVLMFPSKVLE